MRISDWGSDVCSSDLDWFGLLDAQTRNARAWQRLFAHYDAVIAPAWGTTAFPHDDTPITERRLDVDGEDTQFGLQLARSEEHTSELQSLMRISYAVFCLKKKNNKKL